MDRITKVSEKWNECGKRTNIEKFVGCASYSSDIEFYSLSNRKNIIVFWECGEIKSILEQKVANKRYTYQINGQSGTNTSPVYYWNY